MKYIDVVVEPNPHCEECEQRFAALEGPVEVAMLFIEGADGEEALHTAYGLDEGGALVPAWGALVDDSGDGSATLVYGGAWGLRMERLGGGGELFATYVLLPAGAWGPLSAAR